MIQRLLYVCFVSPRDQFNLSLVASLGKVNEL